MGAGALCSPHKTSSLSLSFVLLSQKILVNFCFFSFLSQLVLLLLPSEGRERDGVKERSFLDGVNEE